MARDDEAVREPLERFRVSPERAQVGEGEGSEAQADERKGARCVKFLHRSRSLCVLDSTQVTARPRLRMDGLNAAEPVTKVRTRAIENFIV